MITDKIVEAVRADLLQRSQVGIKKYNTTLERTDLELKDWLQHAYEEALDMANYLKRSITELENKNKMRSKSYNELSALVVVWASQKGILEKATTMRQAEKTHEEVLELMHAIDEDNKEEIIDALGDILVTIIIQAEMQKVNLVDCLESAYNVISKRTGKMVNGQFVKDSTPHSGFDTENTSNT
jgi:NTP pyrophosphatase (non-canonical NTP hydrolase)